MSDSLQDDAVQARLLDPQSVQAALEALLAEEKMSLEAGLDTPLSDDGRRLSSMLSSGLIERPTNWVALAGFMGTGKSRVGWELSRALALHFVDTDKLITRVVGKSIPEVFADEGEGFFRSCEQEVVRRVTRLDHAVISLGGGTFIHEENRRLLLQRGPVVVLWATPETVYQRTKHSDRPLLKAEDPLGRIRTLMDERESVYRQGTIHVHSDGRPSEEIVEEVIERLWVWQEVHGAWETSTALSAAGDSVGYDRAAD